MKPLILIFIFLSVSACCIDDDIDRTGGNTFSANFDGQTIEPEFISSGVIGSYTFYVNRNPENNKDWFINVLSNNKLNIFIRFLNIKDIGSYPIETANLEDWTNVFSKTCMYLQDGTTAQFKALSLGNTGSFEVTKYDSERGILEASFSCDMYDPQHPEIIKPISGNFKINMETHPNYN